MPSRKITEPFEDFTKHYFEYSLKKQLAFTLYQTEFHAVEPADSAENIAVEIFAFGEIKPPKTFFDAENRQR